MYRKRNGSFGFSFTSFLGNAVPGLAADPGRFDHLPAIGKDVLYAHQINSSHKNAPFALDERSCFVGGICESESLSARVLQKLVKVGIVNDQGCVDTRQLVGQKFAHQVAILSVSRQRDLINLLFWWEEECVRLRKLLEEERDLGKNITTLEGGGTLLEDMPASVLNDNNERRLLIDHLKFEREKLRMRIRQSPSERREDVENGTDALSADVPNLLDGHDSSVLSAQGSAAHTSQEGLPPAYRP